MFTAIPAADIVFGVNGTEPQLNARCPAPVASRITMSIAARLDGRGHRRDRQSTQALPRN
jgi:hypothetical protein